MTPSPITGATGNQEFFLHLRTADLHRSPEDGSRARLVAIRAVLCHTIVLVL